MEKKIFFEKRSYGMQFMYLLLFLLTGLLAFSLIAQGCATLIWGSISELSEESQVYYYWFTQIVSSVGAWLLPALLFGYLATGNIYSYAKADKTPKMKAFCLVILLSVVILPVVGGLAYLNEQIHLPAALSGLEDIMRQMEESANNVLELLMSEQSVGALLVNVLIIGALTAVCEEFFFRGAMQPLFERWTGNKHVAIIVTAFIFSAIHFQFFGFIPRFLLGIYLGYLFVWSRSIWLSTAAHFMHNSLSVVLTYYTTTKGIDTDNMDIVPYVPLIVVSVIALAAGVYFLYKMREKEVQEEKIEKIEVE